MKHKIALLLALFLGATAILADSFPAGSRVPQERRATVPAGTRLLVRTVDAIDSSKQRTGQRFTGSLETDLRADDVLVAPRGTPVHGRLVTAQAAGRMAGGAELTLELTDIVINGVANPIVTMSYEVRSTGQGGQTATRIGGGAGLGALIGGIAGGGKGAGIGAAVGAAGGTAASAASGGQQISVPSESLLEFRLEKAVSLPVTK